MYKNTPRNQLNLGSKEPNDTSTDQLPRKLNTMYLNTKPYINKSNNSKFQYTKNVYNTNLFQVKHRQKALLNTYVYGWLLNWARGVKHLLNPCSTRPPWNRNIDVEYFDNEPFCTTTLFQVRHVDKSARVQRLGPIYKGNLHGGVLPEKCNPFSCCTWLCWFFLLVV